MKRPMYVKCGHCKACLQEKAFKRVSRIRNTYKSDYCVVMAALTYKRNNAPYILRDDAFKFASGELKELSVYRDVKYRKVRRPRNGDDYSQEYKVYHGTYILETIDFVDKSSLKGTKDMKHELGRIGVCFYPDYQEFIARFRQNLKRHYNYESKFYIYACSEYGSASHRPHFHLLFFCKKSDAQKFINTIYESWPFSDLRKFHRSVEIAYRASSYVASYVNSGSKFPIFFKDYFCQKHSYSKGFGCNNSAFTLDSLLQKFLSGNLSYPVQKIRDGKQLTVDVPFPSYVIFRYFPKVKGYSRVSPTSLVSYLRRISRFESEDFYSLDCNGMVIPHQRIEYLVDKDIYKANVRLINAFIRFRKDAPYPYNQFNFELYAHLHKLIWNTYNSTILRFHMENQDIPLEEKFDNYDDFYDKDIVDFPDEVKLIFKMSGLDLDLIQEIDPNNFKSNVSNTCRMTDIFNDTIKHKNVSNAIYTSNEDCEL